MIGGSMLGIFGPERTDFKLDAFGLVWLLMLVYITVQPMWVNITSWSTYAKEWFFFATLWGAYLFCYNLFKDSGYHKVILWAANLNAAINIIFAELLIENEWTIPLYYECAGKLYRQHRAAGDVRSLDDDVRNGKHLPRHSRGEDTCQVK